MSNELPSSRAGEYVLGTLPETERVQFEKNLAQDETLRAEVRAWEDRLAPLAVMVPTQEPSARLWSDIERKIHSERSDTRPSDFASMQRLRRSLLRWRVTAAAMGGLAAALALTVFVGLPRSAEKADRDYVAVVNRGGELPALIVRVDLDRRSVQVRSVNAQTPADHSLELWYVNEGHKPSSLGVIPLIAGRHLFPAALRGASVDGSQLAVSVEPKGGSPTGSPTGPIIYSGKLIKADP